MTILTYQEIHEMLHGLYSDDGENIICKHNPFNGEKSFALCLLSQTLALLRRTEISDAFIIQYLQGLLALTNDEFQHYQNYLEMFAPNSEVKAKAIKGERLSIQDKRVLAETMESTLAEYYMKGEYQSCCYSAMVAFVISSYCILSKNIDFYVSYIDIIADLEDEVQSINIGEGKPDKDFIIVKWHSTNKINSIYMLYKAKYPGLGDSTILDLVAADVIEDDYYFKDERFSIAPSILVKQYCAIIEHEVNEIIQLKNLPNKPSKHLMWNAMKNYVTDNGIDLDCAFFELKDLLKDLHGLRNKAAHGDIITKEEYDTVLQYKQDGLFDCLSIKKLALQNIIISPSIDEISQHMGMNP